MSNPKAEKAKAIFERIKSAQRIGQLAVINKEIDDDPDFNMLDKTNLTYLVKMQMNKILTKPLPEIETETPSIRLDNDDTILTFKKKVNQLYTLFFISAQGHPSMLLRDFEKYVDETINLIGNIPDKFNTLLDDWKEYRRNGKRLTLKDDLYWHTDHMEILRGDIEKVQKESEEQIRQYYKTEDCDWGFLDRVRRLLHAIQLMIDNYDEIRNYIDNAKGG